jgi:small conductance mechanosensitive channel
MTKELAIQKIQSIALTYGSKIAMALVILIFGILAARMLSRFIEKAMLTAKVDATLAVFARNIMYVMLMVFVLLAALSQLGIQTASFIAVLEAAGLAIGLALQGTLSNFASGVLIILFRPYKAGDTIKVAGAEGLVKEIQVFSTILHSAENKRIIVPNAKITSDTIINNTL